METARLFFYLAPRYYCGAEFIYYCDVLSYFKNVYKLVKLYKKYKIHKYINHKYFIFWKN